MLEGFNGSAHNSKPLFSFDGAQSGPKTIFTQPKSNTCEQKPQFLKKRPEILFSLSLENENGFTVCCTVSPHLIEAATSYQATRLPSF